MSMKATDDGICDFDRLQHAKPVGAQAYWRGAGVHCGGATNPGFQHPLT